MTTSNPYGMGQGFVYQEPHPEAASGPAFPVTEAVAQPSAPSAAAPPRWLTILREYQAKSLLLSDVQLHRELSEYLYGPQQQKGTLMHLGNGGAPLGHQGEVRGVQPSHEQYGHQQAVHHSIAAPVQHYSGQDLPMDPRLFGQMPMPITAVEQYVPEMDTTMGRLLANDDYNGDDGAGLDEDSVGELLAEPPRRRRGKISSQRNSKFRPVSSRHSS